MRFGWFCYKCFNFSNNGVCVIDEVIQVLVSTPDVRVQVPPRAPNQQNPNQIFPMGDGFGFCVFYRKQFFTNGMPCRPDSKPRGPKKKKSK